MTKATNTQPLSPAASPKLTASQIVPGLNIKINDGTQLPPVDLDLPHAKLLQTWENLYNRYTFPVMSTSDFQNVVHHVMQDPTMSAATEPALEKEVAKRLLSAKRKHEEDLKKLQNEILMDEDIPDDLDELISYIWEHNQHAATQYMVQSYRKLRQRCPGQRKATAKPRKVSRSPSSTRTTCKIHRRSVTPAAIDDRPIQGQNPAPIQPKVIRRRTTAVRKTYKMKMNLPTPLRRSSRIANRNTL
ncbi:hypothetical protein CC80DRAFT_489383 [Byssothecium circinans]|uniref:Uncharacterized protein n=1 Tax=Byssothecium circinans TaxID=147558 RepID=A0A6A5U5K6_9PLEO|nr:hypothetical protein CC80DRAFT_489383 [Byssothecium circinans]